MMKKLVILTGAGISQESGIPTFRDSDGLWNNYSIEDVASPEGWQRNPELVLEFYNQRHKDLAIVKPNAGHEGLAELQKHFEVTIITQNIDDLHERAGSKRVLHLHGELMKKKTVDGRDKDIVDWPIDEELTIGSVGPNKSQYRPHVVWFNEDVPMIWTAQALVNEADIFGIIGTSMQVYPAAGLLGYTEENVPKFILDKNPIEGLDHIKNLSIIRKSACEGIEELKNLLISLI